MLNKNPDIYIQIPDMSWLKLDKSFNKNFILQMLISTWKNIHVPILFSIYVVNEANIHNVVEIE